MLATVESQYLRALQSREVDMKARGISNASCLLLSLTIFSVSPARAAQSGQAGDQQALAAIRAACAEDAQKFCATVQQGGGRIVACLKEHKDSLSDRCKQAAGLVTNPSSSAPSAASSPATPSGSVAGASVSPADPHAKPAPAPKGAAANAGAPEPVILGERWVKRTLVDSQQGSMNAVSIHLPESWHFEGKIEWHYGWVEVPVATSWHAENPANAEAYFQYPLLRMATVDVAPRWRQYVKQPKAGDRLFTGAISMPPVPPLQAMAAFIKKTRGDVTNLKWLGQQDLPGLGKALRLDVDAWPTNQGVAIKIGYDLNGQPVEEAFFGVYYLGKMGNQAVQAGHQAMAANQMVQTDWGFDGLQSFRAPAGTLDKRMPIFCLMAKSVQYDAKWLARQKAIEATLTQMFNQKLQQGWDQIRAADAMTDQIVRNNNQFLDNIGRQEAAWRDSGGSSGGSGGGAGGFLRDEGHDRFSDLMRNVDTMNDPSTGGTKEVSNLGGYNHFTDGFGNYRTYDNPNDTPENHNENGTWTRMTEAP
jgi:hypothetical protein